MKNNENKALCSKCRGRCCKKVPGLCYPSDFKKPLLDNLIIALEGNYEIVYDFIPRPKRNGTGECCFLIKTGCILEFKERPHFCKILIPGEIACLNHHKMDDVILASRVWKKYRDVVERAIEIVNRKDWDAHAIKNNHHLRKM